MTGPDLYTWVAIWSAAIAYTLLRHWKTDWGVGLLATYIVSLAALHWFAPLIYLLPWYEGLDPSYTADGMRQAAWAAFGLALGVEVVNHLRQPTRSPDRDVPSEHKVLSSRMVNLYLAAGVVLYVIIAPVAGQIGGLTAIVSTGSTLIAVGLGLKCWNAWQSRRSLHMWLWIASAAALPLVTVMAQGFLGYGFSAMLVVLAFIASFTRPNWKEAVAAVVVAYLGLSVYVTYMRDRNEIREVVWGGSGIDERADRLRVTFAEAEWFDPRDIDHLQRIDNRLNQNYFIGASIDYIDGKAVQFASGETLWNAVIAIVPRALWPNKPVIGGSGNLVSDYTGLDFAEGTSVGIGHVMEWYVNFGTPGVFIGFTLMGILLAVADRCAARHLHEGHGGKFLLWYLPGVCLLQVSGALGEVTGSAAASLLVAAVLNRWTIARAPERLAPQFARVAVESPEATPR